MNHIRTISISMLILSVLAATAFAAGRLPWTTGSANVATEIQNLKALAPDKGASGCVTQTITKGAIQGQFSSVDGYSGYSAEVVDSAGAAVNVKWLLDGTQVHVGSTYEFTNHRGNTYSRAVQTVYSGASRSLTSCTRRQ